jgi:hypothetical protein
MFPRILEFGPKKGRKKKPDDVASLKRELARVRERLAFLEEYLTEETAETWAKVDGGLIIYTVWARSTVRRQAAGTTPHIVAYDRLGEAEKRMWEAAAAMLYKRLVRHIRSFAPNV